MTAKRNRQKGRHARRAASGARGARGAARDPRRDNPRSRAETAPQVQAEPHLQPQGQPQAQSQPQTLRDLRESRAYAYAAASAHGRRRRHASPQPNKKPAGRKPAGLKPKSEAPHGRRRSPNLPVVAAVAGACVLVVFLGAFLFGRIRLSNQSQQGAPAESSPLAGSSEGSAALGTSAGQTFASAAGGESVTPDQLSLAVGEAVEPIASSAYGQVSVAFVPLEDPAGAYYLNADQQMQSASMIKLPILAEYLRQRDAGTISGDATYTLRGTDIVGGTGSLQSAGAGTAVTYDRLAELMICQSDNVGANVLIDTLGMHAVNAEAKRLGLTQTSLERRMMDTAAQAQGLENRTSARDLSTVLVAIGKGELVSESASADARTWLEEQSDRSCIPAGIPAGVTVGNKTGSVDAARHDGALVLGQTPYVLVVMTDGMGSSADPVIARISSAVWQAVAQNASAVQATGEDGSAAQESAEDGSAAQEATDEDSTARAAIGNDQRNAGPISSSFQSSPGSQSSAD